MQLAMLDLLKEIDAICRKHSIPYWLASGTCLGAIRHGGFIPWDDDCDIEMLEPDYKRFCKVVNSMENSEYVVQNHDIDPGYYHPFGKFKRVDGTIREVQNKAYDRHYRYFGLFVDIFPLVPSSSHALHRIGFFYHRVQALGWRIENDMMWKLYNHTIGAFTRKVIFPALRQMGKVKAKGQLRMADGCLYDKPRYTDDIFPLSAATFENVSLPVPGKVDAYLKKLYGDYNRLPDLDKVTEGTSHFQH